MTRSSITLEVGDYCIAISGADLRIAFESHAKASEDNGATAQAMEVPADSMPGEASRASVGAGTDATIPNPAMVTRPPVSSEPISSQAETKAADAPPILPAPAATHHWYSDDDVAELQSIIKPTASDYRPYCLKPEACGSYKLAHCRACAKAAGLEFSA